MLDVSSIDKPTPSADRQYRDDVPARRLAREIALTLIVKAVLLYGIWSVYFSQPGIDSMIDGMDPGRVSAVIVSPTAFDPTTNSHQERSQ